MNSAKSAPASPLIRPEALDAQRTKLVGHVLLVPRWSTFWLSLVCALLGVAILALLYFGNYTRHATVSGQLLPSAGVMRVTTPQAGVVLERKVSEGQIVKSGDVLFVLSSERFATRSTPANANNTNASGGTLQQIGEQIQQRQKSLADDMARNQALNAQERSYLQRRASTLQSEAQLIEKQIEQQRSRLSVAEDTRKRYQGLADKDYIAREQLTQKELDQSEQQSRLQALQRDLISNQREQANTSRELQGLDNRLAALNAQLQRSIASGSQELAEVESRRQVLITAPQEGQASLLTAEPGQYVDAGKALASIVPAQAQLEARLYVPSRHMGFVRKGDAVLLRYQAYPYQKFGQHAGVVTSISSVPTSAQDLAGFQLPELAQAEPVYSITVSLKNQSIALYGQPRALQAGLRLEADMLQEKRKLWEWMLEPLYSMTGKIAR
ncbi:HlyD family efflux transporter periplasmic adaptor subunit [Variovorax sp. PCZ-1]|uniref:HlyD family secretion protein n=1 Tax=Variovorax sp. PCZ-1 TaxID=2835533 RepID=UPI001BCC76BF|nr:HlyD family efflux transporter periplasmic adaptor subunit [Variovorax sp. PCZ-1]MBS7806609.1 HlyD family efflux transporter periplasmic adaptor subunit [Variovorax sp. PCZ-1]